MKMGYDLDSYDISSYDIGGLLSEGTPPPPSPCTITLVQSNDGNSGGTASVAVTLGSNVVAGHTLIAQTCAPSGIGVSSITDSQNNRWIQCSGAFSGNGDTGIWYARGVKAGSTTVTAILTTGASVGFVVNEWAGIYWPDPLDTWSQTNATSASITPQTVNPRASGDLVICVGSSSGASIGAPNDGFMALTTSGNSGYVVAYDILTSSTVPSTMCWPLGASGTWSACQATFRCGCVFGQNPDLQFPETLVEMSLTDSFLTPLEGFGIWTNITSYVRHMTLGPMGRQHELDRIQATQATVTVNNRDGSFNPWNTESFLYNGGIGLQPMNPVAVIAAWNGITKPIYYGYVQSVLPTIQDVMNIDVDITCMDILQELSLKYLANDNYAQLVHADGQNVLGGYYRCGDQVGTSTVMNFPDNTANVGSLIGGVGGTPLYGATGAFLYDPNTAMDCTNGTQLPNGGFSTSDFTQQPPIFWEPLALTYEWTIELWAKYTGTTSINPGLNSLNNMILCTGYSPDAGGDGAFFIEVGCGNQGLPSEDPLASRIVLANGAVDSVFYTSHSNVIFNGLWHHVVVTQDGATLHVYIDGVLDAGWINTPYYQYPFTNITGMTFGCDSSSNHGWAGLLQDVALYSDYALTASQVANHYATGMWFQIPEYGASVGAEPAGRFNKVLSVTGLPPETILDVPYAFKTELYGETNVVTTTSALNYMQTLSETEPGLIFQKPNGFVTAYNRQYQYNNATSTTSQVTIADAASVSVHYEGPSLQIVNDDLDIWNDIQVQSGRPGSILQVWGPVSSPTAAISETQYGGRTLQGLTSLQFERDPDALAVAQNYGAWYNNPVQRVTQITLNSTGGGGSAIPVMIDRGLYDCITVQYNGQSPGTPFEQESLIEQITHTIVIDGGPLWSTKYALSPYELILNPIILDTSTLDGPDVLTL